MTGRRPRVPGTPGRSFRVEVATGGDPVAALMRAAGALPVVAGQVWDFAVHHDDDCPAIEVGPMSACTCEIVELHARQMRP